MFWLGILACRVQPDCVKLRGDDAFANAVMPFSVALDPEARVGWASSLGNGVLVRFDLDSGEQTGSFTIAESALPLPRLLLSAGELWIGTEAGLFRWDEPTGSIERVGPAEAIDDLVPHPSGVAVLRIHEGERRVSVYSAAGEELAGRAAEGPGALLAHPEGMILFDDAGGTVLDADLNAIGNCTPPFSPVQLGVVLEEGRVVVGDSTRLGFCDGEGWEVGTQNAQALAFGEEALVLDAIGPEEPNLGVAWRVTEQGVERAYITAKNTQFGEIDPETGLIWLNSEGTAEIVALDAESGEEHHRVEVGTFADGVALEPGDMERRWVSGRLSNSIFALRGAEIVATSEAVPWPVSPVFDGERLWVLNQLDGVVVGLHPDTLEPERTFDLDVESNPLLTFGTLTFDPETRRLWATESHADRLYELDPEAGVLRSFDLGGPRVEDPDQIGELAVRVHARTGAIFVARSSDGRLQRLDPESETWMETWVEDLPADRTDVLRIFKSEGWFGPQAFDLDTLELLADLRLPVTRLVGPWPLAGDGWVALSEDRFSLVRIDRHGEIRGTLPFAARDLNAMVLRMVDDERAITIGRASQALACWVDAAQID